MAHRRAKLTVAGRELVVHRILEAGWPAVRGTFDPGDAGRPSRYW
jgi:leucine-zipper of insertion element IS481